SEYFSRAHIFKPVLSDTKLAAWSKKVFLGPSWFFLEYIQSLQLGPRIYFRDQAGFFWSTLAKDLHMVFTGFIYKYKNDLIHNIVNKGTYDMYYSYLHLHQSHSLQYWST
ncbi:unnamed protein product, partial [Owenia fusiformis]